MKVVYFMREAVILLPLVALMPAPVHADDPAGTAALGQDRFLSAKPKLSVIARAPEFALRDTSGQQVRLADYRGRVVLLAFVFTSCKSACPLIGLQMTALQAQLKQAGLFAKKASLLSVTVDPQSDTAEVLARYAQGLGADPTGWRFLHHDIEELRPVLVAYDEWTKLLPAGEIDHPARVYLIDPKGNIREIYSLAFFNERQAYLDIQALLQESN
jgi:protein SCO1